MEFKIADKLDVYRQLSDGSSISVGVLAQSKRGVFFQYHAEYLSAYGNLSPFSLKADLSVQAAPKTPHYGLHGVFADALPDGWGLLLQDRIFRQHGILPTNLTAMDRLAFVGATAGGALSFLPKSEFAEIPIEPIRLNELGTNAQDVFDGQTEEVLSVLVAAGSSGGARPKAQVFINKGNFTECRTVPCKGDDGWIVKFTSSHLSLGHEEGLCEAVYLALAERLSLSPPEWELLDAPKHSGADKWLALKRFDVTRTSEGTLGRLHMHSACGLLDADFRSPSLDYDDLIRATRVLCKSPAAGQLQFKRALFNLLFLNQDDHSKNWAFLQDDGGGWQPAPFYDITFSPHPFGEQATSFAGFGKNPPKRAIQTLAKSAGYAKWQDVQSTIEEMLDEVSSFEQMAKNIGVSGSTIKMIAKQLEASRRQLTPMLQH